MHTKANAGQQTSCKLHRQVCVVSVFCPGSRRPQLAARAARVCLHQAPHLWNMLYCSSKL